MQPTAQRSRRRPGRGSAKGGNRETIVSDYIYVDAHTCCEAHINGVNHLHSDVAGVKRCLRQEEFPIRTTRRYIGVLLWIALVGEQPDVPQTDIRCRQVDSTVPAREMHADAGASVLTFESPSTDPDLSAVTNFYAKPGCGPHFAVRQVHGQRHHSEIKSATSCRGRVLAPSHRASANDKHLGDHAVLHARRESDGRAAGALTLPDAGDRQVVQRQLVRHAHPLKEVGVRSPQHVRAPARAAEVEAAAAHVHEDGLRHQPVAGGEREPAARLCLADTLLHRRARVCHAVADRAAAVDRRRRRIDRDRQVCRSKETAGAAMGAMGAGGRGYDIDAAGAAGR